MRKKRGRIHGVKKGMGKEKTRRDGPAVIISDNHPEKLRDTSHPPPSLPLVVSSVLHQDANKNALSNPSFSDVTLIFSTR